MDIQARHGSPRTWRLLGRQSDGVAPCIAKREELLAQTRLLLASSADDREHLAVLKLLVHVREVTTQLLAHLQVWHGVRLDRSGVVVIAARRPYVWKGESYTKRMKTDVDFLSRAKPLVHALGITQQGLHENPFMLAVTARAESTPSSEPPVWDLKDALCDPLTRTLWADNYLRWCWHYVDQDKAPHSVATAENPSLQKSATPRRPPIVTMPFEMLRPVEIAPALLQPVRLRRNLQLQIAIPGDVKTPDSLIIDGVIATADDIARLAKDPAPSERLLFVLTVVYLLVTPGALTPRDIAWPALQLFYRRGDCVLRALRQCDAGSPDFELKCSGLAPFLQQHPSLLVPGFRPQSLGGVGAALLCAWMLRVMEWKDHDSLELLDHLDDGVCSLYHDMWVCHDVPYVVKLTLAGRLRGITVDIAAQVPKDNRLCVELSPAELADVFGSDVAALYEAKDWAGLGTAVVGRLDALADLPKALNLVA
ncbi:hypothetical protein ACHHYP_04978 [Achlya hypogyna]|uniref:Uncharacterized protein n=1 Tax=Achlya hypogyna TaxID=1202772 RepID=A0A1V9YZC0_ACHHY|nr:hypothetical protein ACHHYP_04978 [Achlya hypogyna]